MSVRDPFHINSTDEIKQNQFWLCLQLHWYEYFKTVIYYRNKTKSLKQSNIIYVLIMEFPLHRM